MPDPTHRWARIEPPPTVRVGDLLTVFTRAGIRATLEQAELWCPVTRVTDEGDRLIVQFSGGAGEFRNLRQGWTEFGYLDGG